MWLLLSRHLLRRFLLELGNLRLQLRLVLCILLQQRRLLPHPLLHVLHLGFLQPCTHAPQVMQAPTDAAALISPSHACCMRLACRSR